MNLNKSHFNISNCKINNDILENKFNIIIIDKNSYIKKFKTLFFKK